MNRFSQICLTIVFLALAWLTLPIRALAATLSLSPASVTINTGTQTTLTLHLDPQGTQVIGTDVILTYNPQVVKIVSVVNSQTFPGNPATIIDNTSGTTKFSLINNYGIYQTAPADIATITIEALTSTNNSPLSFQMTPGDTKDTNVVIPNGQDALTSVIGTGLNFNNPPGEPGPTATPTPTPTPASTVPAASVTLPPSASNQAQQSLTKTRPGNPPAVGQTNPQKDGFLSPLPSAPAARSGRILGATNDLMTTQAQARSILWYLLPVFLGLVGVTLLIRVLRSTRQIPAAAPVAATPAWINQPVPEVPLSSPRVITYYHP